MLRGSIGVDSPSEICLVVYAICTLILVIEDNWQYVGTNCILVVDHFEICVAHLSI